MLLVDLFAEWIACSGVQEDDCSAQKHMFMWIQHSDWLDTTDTNGELELGRYGMEENPVKLN
jgi:hypothetical protein